MDSSPSIAIVGTGPGPVSALTDEARHTLLGAGRVLFRLTGHPVHHWLRGQGVPIVPLDFVYDIPRISYDHVYGLIADIVVREARLRGRAVYALPGHPMVFEATTGLIIEQAAHSGMSVRIVPGVSFIDELFAELRLDPASGVQIVSALDVSDALPSGTGTIVAQLFAKPGPGGTATPALIASVDEWLARRYPADHPVSLVWNAGAPGYETKSRTFPRAAFRDTCEDVRPHAPLASAYVPGTKK